MPKYFFLLILFLFAIGNLFAQSEMPIAFEEKLSKASIEILIPLENKYKPIGVHSTPYMPYDYALRSKKGKLEIRYSIKIFEDSTSAVNQVPHLQCMNTLTNIASNHEEAVTTIHSIADSDLEEHFNADWGMVAYLQPKQTFGDYKHCKMLALFKEGKAMTYVYFLFDEASIELDNRFHAIQFLEDNPK